MTLGLGNCVDLEWFETRPPMVEAARLTLSTFTGVATVLDGQGYTNIRTEHLDGHQLRLCADSPGSPGPGLLPPLPWHLPFGKLTGVPGCAESLDAAHRALAYPFGAWLFQNADGRLCALPESMFFELYRKRAQ